MIVAGNGVLLSKAAGFASAIAETPSSVCGAALAVIAREQSQRGGDPCGGGIVVIDIAIDARQKARCAELLEAPVEPLARLAELFIGRIAKRQHAETQTRKGWSLAAFEEFEEVHSRLRRVALAIGAGDEEEVLLLPQPARLVLAHVGDRGVKAKSLRLNGRGAGQSRAIARLGSVKNGQRAGPRGCDWRLAAGARRRIGERDPGSRARAFEAGEIAAEPERLARR